MFSGIFPPPCDSQHPRFDDKVPSQLQPVRSLLPHPMAPQVIDTPSDRAKCSTLLQLHCWCGQQNSLGNRQTVAKLSAWPARSWREVSCPWFLARHHCASQLGLPERERMGHSSAWYSTSKDEVRLLCPAPPAPCTPTSAYSRSSNVKQGLRAAVMQTKVTGSALFAFIS